jgi:uncharacterized protein (DUF1501 family)
MQFRRREFLRIGLTGFAGLTLPGLFRLRAAQSAVIGRRSAVILVWLRGGPSHLETFDPKPAAPLEYRGPYQPIVTNVNGIHISELLPKLSHIADRYAILRSMAHSGGGHPAGSLQVLSGDPDAADKPQPVYPDWMSIANYARFDPSKPLPNYIGVHPITNYDNFVIAGPTYLGPAYGPFMVHGDPSAPGFRVPNVGLEQVEQAQRFSERVGLRRQFDEMQRSIDQTPTMDALDQFQQQALNLLTSPESRTAFDLTGEPDRVRDAYGRHAWGQQCLLARRLVEAGVDIVATEFTGAQCARVHNWDDHAVNHHVFEALKFRLPFFDQSVSALISDIYERGLDREVLVIVGGEFGRTPRISYVGSSGGGVASGPAGTVQPGRDHWPSANSMLFAGGGIRTGQVIGATDARGEQVIEGRATPGDFLATIYRHLGIDQHLAIPDFTGRPIPILREGSPIAELTA